jgi:adenine-specific DNA-methyltransferase
LKVLADNIFGRTNFRNELVWSYRTGGASKKTSLPKKHDVILTYAKSPAASFNGLHERQYLEKSFMGSKVDEEGRFYVDTIVRDIFEGVIISPQGNELKEYNVRPVLNLSSERVEDFQSQKPEGLIQLLLDISTKEGDIVLDYHLGSGTTATAAHKMGRQYIGIEQLDYGKNDSVVRLKEVIAGDQTGISKNVGWVSGGSFVYGRLLNDVNVFIKEVEKANDSKELSDLLTTVLSSNFLSYRVDPSLVDPKTFSGLPVSQQKSLLIELVNKNKLYVNYHDVNDSSYKIDASTKKINSWLQGRE